MEAATRETIIATIRPGLHITQTCLRVGNRHFQLDALSNLEARQAAHHPLTRNAAILAGLCGLALVFLSRFMHPAGIAATVIVMCGLLLVVVVSVSRRPRQIQLWATYRGQRMTIFATDDEWLFGAVERQLHRSIVEVRRGKLQVPHRLSEPAVPHPSTLHPSSMHPAALLKKPVVQRSTRAL